MQFTQTFQEFVEIVKELYTTYACKDDLISEMKSDWITDCRDERLIIGKSIVTGGSSGGSCYDETPQSETFSTGNKLESPTEFLFVVLQAVNKSNIPLDFYQSKIAKLIKEDSYREGGYYGNYTEHEYFSIHLLSLYQALSEHI